MFNNLVNIFPDSRNEIELAYLEIRRAVLFLKLREDFMEITSLEMKICFGKCLK